MASAARRGRTGPKLTKITIAGKFSPEKFHYCPQHEVKMKAVKTWGAGMHFHCPEGCNIPKGDTILK